jgi:hypothetical protein
MKLFGELLCDSCFTEPFPAAFGLEDFQTLKPNFD